MLFWEVLLLLWKAITIAKKGKYQLLHLKQRYKRVAMPKVQIVDLKTEACPYGVFYLSQTLFTALAENLKAKKQSVIFLNRRGFASVIICEDCQNKMQCPRCSVLLTCHKFIKKTKVALVCHYCQVQIAEKSPLSKMLIAEATASRDRNSKSRTNNKISFSQSQCFLDSDSFSNPQELESHFQKSIPKKWILLWARRLLVKGITFLILPLACILLADMFLNLRF